jgi:hypothetical protein
MERVNASFWQYLEDQNLKTLPMDLQEKRRATEISILTKFHIAHVSGLSVESTQIILMHRVYCFS